MKRNKKLQELCRKYLKRVRPIADKFGLAWFVDETIAKNMRNECAGTEEEVQILSRICDDERIQRSEIPEIVGKSYRQCMHEGIFDKIKRLHRSGIYSKIGAILLGSELKALEDE